MNLVIYECHAAFNCCIKTESEIRDRYQFPPRTPYLARLPNRSLGRAEISHLAFLKLKPSETAERLENAADPRQASPHRSAGAAAQIGVRSAWQWAPQAPENFCSRLRLSPKPREVLTGILSSSGPPPPSPATPCTIPETSPENLIHPSFGPEPLAIRQLTSFSAPCISAGCAFPISVSVRCPEPV